MNYLGHLLLSGKDENIILGNLIADSVKGEKYKLLTKKIQEGIWLHRKIDSFTDANFYFRRSVERLQPRYHKYSGVLVDMFYDHFLAVNWTQYSEMPLRKAAENAYYILLNHHKILPERFKSILPFMIHSNWLVNYASLNHLNRHFKGLARRSDFKSGMENALEDLTNDYPYYYEDFFYFMPEIIAYISENTKTS